MKYDLGLTTTDPSRHEGYRLVFNGWRGALKGGYDRELAILCRTPGIPIEWVYAVFNLRAAVRRKLAKIILDRPSLENEVNENRDSICLQDGFAMLNAIPEPGRYQGAIPLWSQLALSQERKLDVDRATEFGVNPQKAQRWRTHQVYDPLTLRRVVSRRGNPKLILPL